MHSFLISIFPVLVLYYQNIESMPWWVIIRPSIAGICFAGMSWLILYILIRNKEKTSIITSYFLLLFFVYGKLLVLIRNVTIAGISIGKYEYTLLGWVLIFAIPVRWILKAKKKLPGVTKFLNVFAVFLIGYNVILSGYWLYDHKIQRVFPSLAVTKKVDKQPDIYYIVFDAYARDDILKKFYDYDNHEFLDYLSNKGFYVARQSLANYAFTELSIASSLNMTYLDHLAQDSKVADSNNRIPLIDMIRSSRISTFLKKRGYKTFAFSTGFSPTEIRNADYYLSQALSLSDFENALINTTPLPLLTKNLQSKLHRDRIIFTLSKLPEIAKTESPKFVFVHIFAPHPPFVFGEHGETLNYSTYFYFADNKFVMPREDYVKKYKSQLIFLNRKIQDALTGIIANSDRQPIIIIQGDHGPRSMVNLWKPDDTLFSEAMSILLACRLPNNDHHNFYNSVTPVNIFRIILNQYFGTDLQVLEDNSYFSTLQNYFKFIDVKDKITREFSLWQRKGSQED